MRCLSTSISITSFSVSACTISSISKINSGIFPDNVWANFRYWFDTYAKPKIVELIGDSIKLVWFGLTDDGYFVAYIPESWDEITFDTVMDYASEYYGHLVLVHTESINNIPVWQGGDY